MDELNIPLGKTYRGFEFIKIRKYKRKQGFRIYFILKTFRGKFITLATEEAKNAREIITKINKNLLPIFELPDEIKRDIEEFG